MNIDKLSSTARKLGVFFKVIQKIVGICAIVMLCVLAVLTVANAINPDIVIGTGLNSVDIGYLTIVMAPEDAPSNATILIFTWIIAIAGAVCAAVDRQTSGRRKAAAHGKRTLEVDNIVCVPEHNAVPIKQIAECIRCSRTVEAQCITVINMVRMSTDRQTKRRNRHYRGKYHR